MPLSKHDIYYGHKKRHVIKAQKTNDGLVFWPVPGGYIFETKQGARNWTEVATHNLSNSPCKIVRTP